MNQTTVAQNNDAARRRERNKQLQRASNTKKPSARRSKKGQQAIQTLQNNFTAEMNELKSKIRTRYDSKRKPMIKKEDVGYEGPYIRTFQSADADVTDDGPNRVPVVNFIVDDLEAHISPSESNKQRFKLDKPAGLPADMPMVCSFCHLDPNGERQTDMGDLIGPIIVPAEVRWPRRMGEDKTLALIHAKCLQWSSNFRMVGFELADARALFEDAKNVS